MNREAQAAVLLLTGVALLHAGLSDLYLRYVKAGLQPLLLAAGAVLVAAALATVWYELRGPRRRTGQGPGDKPGDKQEDTHDAHDAGHAHPHPHPHHEPKVAWLLVLPVLALVLVAPPALGSYSAARTGTSVPRPFGFPALPAGDPLRMATVDYAGRAVYDRGRSLSGRQVTLTGFVSIGRDGTPYLTRMVLNCCAADARPVKIGLTGQVPPVLRPDAWLEVTGTYTPRRAEDPVNDGPVPFLDVSRARPVREPAEPYEG
ncbi:TIGR03943 family putative permease subunit [Actinacidiphila glaucinigra]|uniref:Putative membrane protein n=1 Tax=Actinacidiphila glaucinigra TaxID=235986 RepID=A0A239NV87_9ACTN|nr:TIGR03943 family protein [Actinacidiphila glaucinigra]SNT58787.1 putative membrane protein [Actinacidiphila glaucinigra]